MSMGEQDAECWSISWSTGGKSFKILCSKIILIAY